MIWKKTRRSRELRVGVRSDVGRVRHENQDAWGCFPDDQGDVSAERLFVVADGMGGHARGHEASHTAVETVREVFFSQPERSVAERLHEAFEAANARIYRAAGGDAAVTMGTTCTALVLADSRLYVAHVGDSRAYRIDRRNIRQLTRDHTLVEELRREGVLNEEESRAHPRRNVLTRALGVETGLRVDLLKALPVQPRVSYLLCTDGLQAAAEEIRDVTLAFSPQQACDRLVQITLERGAPDNVTVLLVAFE